MIQDEIREGIGTWLSYFKEGKQNLTVEDGVKWIMEYLDSKGVVISIPDSPDEPDDFYYGKNGPPTIKDGMVMVKPLIKEKKNENRS